jgi:tetratricopeptide (TPR) repeat protein
VKKWWELRKRASLAASLGDLPKAISDLKNAIELADDANPIDKALLFNFFASVLFRNGEMIAAERAANESIRLELEFGDCGQETTRFADFAILKAKILEKQNRFQEATTWSKKGLEVFEKLLGEDSEYVKNISNFDRFLNENRWRG